jgi:hypothetical protein
VSKDNVVKLPAPRMSDADVVSEAWALACELMHSESARLLNADAVACSFLTTTKRHDYVYERVPIGHVMGWRCYDPARYDGAADGNTNCGYGITKDEAYLDEIGGLPATSAERELDEAIDEALDFDCGLEDRDAG